MMDYERLYGLAGVMAAERTHERPEMFEDVRQEAMIAGWQAHTASPDKPHQYVHAAMRNGANDLLRGRAATGAASQQGKQDAHSKAGPLVDSFDNPLPVPDLGSAEALDAIEATAEVKAAILTLPPGDREIVFGRYWLGERFSDIAARTNRKTGTLSRRWTESIRPALAEHLTDAA